MAPHMLMLVCLVGIASCIDPRGVGDDWSYDRQDLWPDTCFGRQQSPVEIVADSIAFNADLGREFVCPYLDDLQPHYFSGAVINNGRTIEVVIEDPTGNAWCQGFPGANSKDRFRLEQVHLHWGVPADRNGAEHSLPAGQADLEAHLVHFNERFGSYNEALGQRNGIGIVAILFRRSRGEESEGNPLLQFLSKVEPKIAFTKQFVNRVDFGMLVGGTGLSIERRGAQRFFTYQGSLTTPPCTESVTWVIADGTGVVDDNILRRMQVPHRPSPNLGSTLAPNHRKVQAMNRRAIIASWSESINSSRDKSQQDDK